MFATAYDEVNHRRGQGQRSNAIKRNGELWVWWFGGNGEGYHWGGRYPIPAEGFPWCGY
jgi:hypothetical protein